MQHSVKQTSWREPSTSIFIASRKAGTLSSSISSTTDTTNGVFSTGAAAIVLVLERVGSRGILTFSLDDSPPLLFFGQTGTSRRVSTQAGTITFSLWMLSLLQRTCAALCLQQLQGEDGGATSFNFVPLVRIVQQLFCPAYVVAFYC